MMEWNFNNETPIYLQIIDRFKMDIANGSLKPGNKVPSVRELALSAGVNPNTCKRLYPSLSVTAIWSRDVPPADLSQTWKIRLTH